MSRRQTDPLRIRIAGDENGLCEALRDLLAGVWPEARIIAAPLRIDASPAAHAHVLVLDIALPPASGRSEASGGPRTDRRLTFVAAYARRIRDGKPDRPGEAEASSHEAARLVAAVARLKGRASAASPPLEAVVSQLAQPPAHDEYLRWISAARRGELELVPVADVRFFHSDAKYTRVAIASRDVLIHKPIAQLAGELDPAVFWQVHRSTIVNVNAIARVCRAANGRLVLSLKDRAEVIAVSQTYAHRFHQM